MAETITAIYENGIIRPLESVNLKEHQKIKIKIEPDSKWSQKFKTFLKEIRQSSKKYSSELKIHSKCAA